MKMNDIIKGRRLELGYTMKEEAAALGVSEGTHASYLHSIGIPDAYIMERGGWSTPHVMQKVYRHALADKVDPMALKAVSAFQQTFQADK